jgi:hypothetical protein
MSPGWTLGRAGGGRSLLRTILTRNLPVMPHKN